MNSSKDIVSGASQDVVDTIPPAFQEIAGPSVTVVTMKNSSNVEIKPTTQYYAPVTIYQYAPENSEDNNLPSAPVKDSVNNFGKFTLYRLIYIEVYVLINIFIKKLQFLKSSSSQRNTFFVNQSGTSH